MDVDDQTPVLEALEAISGVVTRLAEKPLSHRLHYQYITLTRLAGIEEELNSARKTLTTYLATSEGALPQFPFPNLGNVTDASSLQMFGFTA